ncbi:secondary thiamine-phosphate synthase enzyme YjbQ [Commensalibacter oyaizuii]|uniref:Secondary thiamine-phosphate synthase enzyme YjbQ n=1 Tax=Commensalibacter oyaizuii TaxID=3043873 RepID=A0ABT6Q149_9PROT|nr:secondary thiamine-phosphate synthase enzyme YjbQ [Commensalibacter sp. TBRC 16381]MDI2090818.1 secondary thiamine-phosphate synthase enzyme YjbQ [Commensalibacter sp. TBRC 16381]
MKQQTSILQVQTHGQGLTMLNMDLSSWILKTGIVTGLLTLWCKHTSASFIVQENADPDVREDILHYLNDLVPENRHYLHHSEGPDDMPAHIKAVLTQTQLSIPIVERQMVLGIWQGIYLFEHRRQPHLRQIALHVLGE